jgi:hypothetical protein
MEQGHAIDFALDLARLPALARTSVAPPLPPKILELIRIAAACPEACEAAVAWTGKPTPVLIEAARFYLQQVLFRPEADCYRILGIERGASRETARNHMRWLLEWLHPDRNGNSWDAVYAERVLKAWREVSFSHGTAAESADFGVHGSSNRKRKVNVHPIWVPWIAYSDKPRLAALRSYHPRFILWIVPTGLVIIFLALWSINMLVQP